MVTLSRWQLFQAATLVTILAIGTVLGAFAPHSAHADAAPTSTSTKPFPDGGPLWDTPLGCPANMELAEGPTWHGITIGKSSFRELQAIYGKREWIPISPRFLGNFTPMFQIWLEDSEQPSLELPSLVYVCVIRNTVAAMMLYVDSNLTFPSDKLARWLALYGKPEIVTWHSIVSDMRILIWPQYGTSIVVGIVLEDKDTFISLGQTYVTNAAFFPYAKGTDYLSKWPFAQMPKSPPPTDSDYGKIYNPLLAFQNPFDFDSMMKELSATPTEGK